jgi:hypothetical protein
MVWVVRDATVVYATRESCRERAVVCVSGLCESSCQTEGAIAALHFLFLPANVNATELAAWSFPHNCCNFTRVCQYHYKSNDDRSKSSLETYMGYATLGECLTIGLGILEW